MANTAWMERIIRFVAQEGYEPRTLERLARAMGLGEGEMGDFHDAVKALMSSGRVVMGSRNSIMLPDPTDRVLGKFRGNPRGFGFVVPDAPNAHGDLFIPPDRTGGAVTGDTVIAQVRRRRRGHDRSIYEGAVVSVVQRGQSRFVGELHRQQHRWFVIPDGNILHVPIFIADVGAKDAAEGDQVVVEIVQYPDEWTEARGVIVRVLGSTGDPEVDTQSIIEQYQLPREFPDDVLTDARAVVDAFDLNAELLRREDLRQSTIITIDPVDARDFDDAISLEQKPDGTVELGVHVADVSHFVREASPLDREARERANSVYLPRRVIPMLPEVLSNGLCSLQEGEPRLTKSVFIRYDAKGRVKAARFANTVIASAKRLEYVEAQRILDGHKGRVSARVANLLLAMETLARAIQKRRMADGQMDFDLPDVELVYDGAGRVVDVTEEDRSYTHKIIEMFMVEANEAVARLLADLKVPALRRIHDQPSPAALTELSRFMAVLGLKLPDAVDSRSLQKFLAGVEGRPDTFTIHLAVLKSMQQAEYSPLPVGHFALASRHYLHFTSPIRRYPDLTVHRLLHAYLQNGSLDGRMLQNVPSEHELIKLGNHCSANERRAEAAERELRLVKILRLLHEKHLGDRLHGVVTGVTSIGVFVQIEKYLIDGLVRFADLPEDWWEVEASRGAVVGERTGLRIRIGDRLKVAISRVDIPGRQLDLALAQSLERPARTPAAPARRTKSQNRRPQTRNPKPPAKPRRGGKKPKRR